MPIEAISIGALSTQLTAPVVTRSSPSNSSTRTGSAGSAGRPGSTSYDDGGCSAGPIACADHLIEPSGHDAVVQLCTGVPSAKVNWVPSATVPRGQGTPQVTPWAAGVSSQWTVVIPSPIR